MATATKEKPESPTAAPVSPPSQHLPAKVEPAPPARAAIGVGTQGVNLTSIEAMYRFAQAVAVSGWAPKGMERAEAIVVAIQYGLEVGLTPMAALQNIAVINGRPSMFGDAQLALIRASGRCEHYSESLTDDTAHLKFIELQFAIVAGDGAKVAELRKALALAGAAIKLDKDDQGFSTCTLRSGGQLEFDRFTIADAKRAGLWGKSGPWKEYPKRMLKFRARSFLLRDQYGDVIKGLISFEEARDQPAALPESSLAALPAGRSSLRRSEPVEVNGTVETPVADEQHQPAPPDDDPEPRADQQHYMEIDQLIADKNVSVRHWRTDFARRHNGKPPAEMTAAEAAEEIQRLKDVESSGGGAEG